MVQYKCHRTKWLSIARKGNSMYYKNEIRSTPKEKKEQVQRLIDEMISKLGGTSESIGSTVVVSAYLLHKVSQLVAPDLFCYADIQKGKLNLSPDVLVVADQELDERRWESLREMLPKFSSDEFAMAALLVDLTAYEKYGPHMTPDSVTRLAQEILQIRNGDCVADLGCGYGGFLNTAADVCPNAEYFGYEIDLVCKVVAEIRAELLGSHLKLEARDAFTLLEEQERPIFDRVFFNYPFGMKLRHLGTGNKVLEALTQEDPAASKATSSDWVYNALLCSVMGGEGKAVGIMTNGSTSNSIDATMRQYFVENGLVEAVIALPPRMFYATNIPTTMVVFSHHNDAVRLVDASRIFEPGRRLNTFSEENIREILDSLDCDNDHSKLVSKDDLRNKEYTLSFSSHSEETLAFEHGMPFEQVIKSISRGAPCTAKQLDSMVSDKPTNMQYLMLSNIQNGMLDNQLPYLDYIDPKYEKYCLKNNSLILSKNGYPYKVAVASIAESQKILANGNLYIIELDESKVNPYYIKAFLESKQGISALKRITVGATIPSIGVDKLKKLMVPVPPMEEQMSVVEKYQQTLWEIDQLKKKIAQATDRLQRIFDEEKKM